MKLYEKLQKEFDYVALVIDIINEELDRDDIGLAYRDRLIQSKVVLVEILENINDKISDCEDMIGKWEA